MQADPGFDDQDESRPSVEGWYRRYSPELVRYATALVGPANATDLVAETFVGLLRRGDRHLATVREPRSYLYRAVTNAARMSARSDGRRSRREHLSVVRSGPGDSSAAAGPELIDVLRRLPVLERSVVYFTYWADQTGAEVAAILSISERSVKRHLANARATLRAELSWEEQR